MQIKLFSIPISDGGAAQQEMNTFLKAHKTQEIEQKLNGAMVTKGVCKPRHAVGSNRVLRGGSWNNNAENCRSANRNSNTPG